MKRTPSRVEDRLRSFLQILLLAIAVADQFGHLVVWVLSFFYK